MSKTYKDLSRRDLIKLNKNFDKRNNNSLQEYLNDHEDDFEGIRPIEVLTEKVDEAKIAIKNGSKDSINRFLSVELDKAVDNILNVITLCEEN